MNCLIVPTLALDNADLITRFAASVDYPVRHKMVVNNGRIDALDEFHAKHPDWLVKSIGQNLGCAASWNLFPACFPDERACLICNDDEVLQPGCLERICKESDEHCRDCSIIYVNTCESLGIFVWTKRGIARFGEFDENFWPAYREDWDMKARFKTQKPDHYCIAKDEYSFPVQHGKPFPCSKRFHDTLETIWSIDSGYFARKWGAANDWHSWMKEGPHWDHPFGETRNGVWDWTLNRNVRDRREWIWNDYFSDTTSLYK